MTKVSFDSFPLVSGGTSILGFGFFSLLVRTLNS